MLVLVLVLVLVLLWLFVVLWLWLWLWLYKRKREKIRIRKKILSVAPETDESGADEVNPATLSCHGTASSELGSIM
jgi:hypothetical protein